MNIKKRKKVLKTRRLRIRKKVKGTACRPRLSLRLSNQHMYAQCIDDKAPNGGKTLAFLSTLDKEVKGQGVKPNTEGAAKFGQLFAEKLKAQGSIEKLVFDRGGRKYHGCVKAFADSVRNSGLQF